VDPHLDILVPPVVHVLRQLITDENIQDSTLFWKTNLLSELLYVYMNFRGYKTIRWCSSSSMHVLSNETHRISPFLPPRARRFAAYSQSHEARGPNRAGYSTVASALCSPALAITYLYDSLRPLTL
jgi:hypothetical protein